MYLVLAFIAVATFVVYAVFNVLYLMDLKKTSHAVRRFVVQTENTLIPALAEMRTTLEEVKKVASDVSLVTDKLRTAANAIVTVEKTIQDVYSYYRKGFGETASANVSAVKAGIMTGVLTLVKNLKTKKEESP